MHLLMLRLDKIIESDKKPDFAQIEAEYGIEKVIRLRDYAQAYISLWQGIRMEGETWDNYCNARIIIGEIDSYLKKVKN